MSHIHNRQPRTEGYNPRTEGYNPRTGGYDPEKFRLPSEDFTPKPLPHVDCLDIGSHSGWDPTLIRPTFLK